MSWLIDAFGGENLVWLFITTIVAIVSGFLTSWMTYRLKKQEIIDKANLEIAKSREERVRQEITRWANPILGAVEELDDRLDNILNRGGYLALNKGRKQHWIGGWSISYDYFMPSTLYLFSQYFAWVQMLKERLSFELFHSQTEKDRFFEAIRDVGDALSNFPTDYQCSEKNIRGDTQVFRLQQRAIGELLIICEGNNTTCLRYPAFLQKLNTEEFDIHLEPLRLLLEGLNPRKKWRWKRVETAHRALKQLKELCHNILK